MWNPPTKKQLDKIPPLYSQENEKDPKVYMKFFMGGWTWYAMEFDGKDMFFGLVKSPIMPEGELGYFSLRELMNLKKGFVQVDRDLHGVTPYSPKRLSEVKKGKY